MAKIALASCFLGFGIWEVVSPNLWTIYLPEAVRDFYPIQLVFLHGVVLIVVALGVLSGKMQRFFTAVATLILLNICIELFLQDGLTETLIRDVALLLFTLALFIDALKKKA